MCRQIQRLLWISSGYWHGAVHWSRTCQASRSVVRNCELSFVMCWSKAKWRLVCWQKSVGPMKRSCGTKTVFPTLTSYYGSKRPNEPIIVQNEYTQLALSAGKHLWYVIVGQPLWSAENAAWDLLSNHDTQYCKTSLFAQPIRWSFWYMTMLCFQSWNSREFRGTWKWRGKWEEFKIIKQH